MRDAFIPQTIQLDRDCVAELVVIDVCADTETIDGEGPASFDFVVVVSPILFFISRGKIFCNQNEATMISVNHSDHKGFVFLEYESKSLHNNWNKIK